MRFVTPDLMRPARACRLLLLALVVLLGGAAAVPVLAQDPPVAALPAPVDTLVRPVGPIRPGDVLQLRVHGEAGVSGEYIIDNEGVVTIPGIGSIRLANLPPRDARARLDAEIRRRFANPEFSADFRIRVYVLGAGVANPGPFVVEPGTTFLHVLAIAGGQTERADLRRTTVNREGKTYPVDLAAGLAGGHVGQLPIFSNDVIVIPARGGLTRENITFALSLFSTALTVATLIASLNRD